MISVIHDDNGVITPGDMLIMISPEVPLGHWSASARLRATTLYLAPGVRVLWAF